MLSYFQDRASIIHIQLHGWEHCRIPAHIFQDIFADQQAESRIIVCFFQNMTDCNSICFKFSRITRSEIDGLDFVCNITAEINIANGSNI